jgi:hypothetical protein
MINLFDAFAEFISTHPAISEAEKRNISACLKNLLDADPEKEIMRRTLEHYANEFNWPYMVESPDGQAVFGMEAVEATQLARNALNSSQDALEACLLSMYEEQGEFEMQADVRLMVDNRVA